MGAAEPQRKQPHAATAWAEKTTPKLKCATLQQPRVSAQRTPDFNMAINQGNLGSHTLLAPTLMIITTKIPIEIINGKLI